MSHENLQARIGFGGSCQWKRDDYVLLIDDQLSTGAHLIAYLAVEAQQARIISQPTVHSPELEISSDLSLS